MRGALIGLCGYATGRAALLALTLLVARHLGPTDFGTFSVGLAVLGIAGSLAMLGLPNAVIRYGSLYATRNDSAGVRGTVASALILGVALSSITSLSLMALATPMADFLGIRNDVYVLRFAALGIPPLVILWVIASSTMTHQSMAYDSLARAGGHPLLQLCLVAVGVGLGGALFDIMALYVAGTVGAVILAGVLLHIAVPEVRERGPIRFNFKELMSMSIPLVVTSLSFAALVRIDRILIASFRPSAEVGLYAAAAALALNTGAISEGVRGILGPVFSRQHALGQREELRATYRSFVRWAFKLSAPVFLIMLLYRREALRLFGEEFVDAQVSLVALSGGMVIMATAIPAGQMLQYTGRYKLDSANHVGAIMMNVALNLVLIPFWGQLGAAIATSISLALLGFSRLAQAWRVSGQHPDVVGLARDIFMLGLVFALAFWTRPIFQAAAFTWIIGSAMILLVYLGAVLGLDTWSTRRRTA